MTTYKVSLRYLLTRDGNVLEYTDDELVDADDLISAVKFAENLPGYVKANGKACAAEEIPDTEIDDEIISNTFYANGRPEDGPDPLELAEEAAAADQTKEA